MGVELHSETSRAPRKRRRKRNAYSRTGAKRLLIGREIYESEVPYPVEEKGETPCLVNKEIRKNIWPGILRSESGGPGAGAKCYERRELNVNATASPTGCDRLNSRLPDRFVRRPDAANSGLSS